MVDVKRAYSTVIKENPGMKVNTCIEQDQYYVFSLIPEDLKEKDGFANSCVYLINKNTGEYTIAHFTLVINNQIVREIKLSELE